MFIDFPATPNEGFKLDSLAFSFRNDAVSDKQVESIAKPVAGVNPILKKTAGFCEVKSFRSRISGVIGCLLGDLHRHWQGLHP